jgi:hypothetical protein
MTKGRAVLPGKIVATGAVFHHLGWARWLMTAPVGMTVLLQGQVLLDEAVAGTNRIVIPTGAKRRDLRFSPSSKSSNLSLPSPLVIRGIEVEGSAVRPSQNLFRPRYSLTSISQILARCAKNS